MLHLLRAAGTWLLVFNFGLAVWIAPIGALSTTNSQPIDPRAFSTCAQLPLHVDLSGLTDTQLITYGLPTHEVLDADLAQWEHVLARNPQRVCVRPTPLGYSVSHPQQSAAPYQVYCNPPQAGELCASGNWDGEETLGARGTYRYSNMYIYVPQAIGSVGDIASFWTGVGGDPKVAGSNAVLVQDGVATTVTSNGQYNESWVEVAPNVTPYNLPLCRLWAGDQLYSFEESNYQNVGYDYFYMQNVTANCSNQCYVHTNNQTIHDTCGFTGGASFNSDSATGEDIAERPNGFNLAHWNPSSNSTVNIGPCNVMGQDLGAFPYFSRYISDGTYDVADLGGLVDSTNFDVYWWRAS